MGNVSATITAHFALDGNAFGFLTFVVFRNGEEIYTSPAPIPVAPAQKEESIYVPVVGPGAYQVRVILRQPDGDPSVARDETSFAVGEPEENGNPKRPRPRTRARCGLRGCRLGTALA